MAENPAGVSNHLGFIPGKPPRQLLESILFIGIDSWDQLCPKYDALTPSQLGATNSREQAANITTRLFPE